MSDSIMLPVIVGLAIGIALILLFSIPFRPALSLSDDEIIKKTQSLKEVRFFLEKHPNANVTVDRSAFPDRLHVYYSVQTGVSDPNSMYDGVREKQLVVIVDPRGGDGMAMFMNCLAPISTTVDDGVSIDLINEFCN